MDEYFQRTDSAGARHFLTDALGSTVALADSTGTLQTQYTFEPFGNTSSTGAATTSSFAYTGRELDGTGLYFFRARYYSPQLQEFVSEDPAGFNGGSTNLYSYAKNGPTNFRDPSGKNPACLIGGLLGTIGYNGSVIYRSLWGRKANYYAGWSGLGHKAMGNAAAFGAGCAFGLGLGGPAAAGELAPTIETANVYMDALGLVDNVAVAEEATLGSNVAMTFQGDILLSQSAFESESTLVESLVEESTHLSQDASAGGAVGGVGITSAFEAEAAATARLVYVLFKAAGGLP